MKKTFAMWGTIGSLKIDLLIIIYNTFAENNYAHQKNQLLPFKVAITWLAVVSTVSLFKSLFNPSHCSKQNKFAHNL